MLHLPVGRLVRRNVRVTKVETLSPREPCWLYHNVCVLAAVFLPSKRSTFLQRIIILCNRQEIFFHVVFPCELQASRFIHSLKLLEIFLTTNINKKINFFFSGLKVKKNLIKYSSNVENEQGREDMNYNQNGCRVV